MKVLFLGGTETVTGSKFLLETENTRVLVDCGLFQGYKWLRNRNREPFPLDPNTIDAVLLTHAHLDHSGYIPVLYREGYRGPVYTHRATMELCEILLADSGHLQEEEARFYKKHRIGKHEDPQPLYNRRMAQESMELFEPLEFREQCQVGDITFYLQCAGHILGAASIIVEAEGKRIGFSGDVGRPDDFFMPPPDPLPELDTLLLESTYGNRLHDEVDPFEEFAAVVNETAAEGGTLLIPSFSVGRAQRLQHMLTHMMQQGRVPDLPIYLDSPMAINVSGIYHRYNHEHLLTDEQSRAMGEKVVYTRSVDESKALADLHYPHIIIAGSGMATGGRILHHMKRLLGDHRTTVMFSGYQAGGTRGSKMLAGSDSVKIHGRWIENKARVEQLDGLSGHADYRELGEWLQQSALSEKLSIQLVHGEAEALEAFRDYLLRTTKFSVNVADYRKIETL
ncbi:MAG: MBL fold metallo-hydrolase [Thiohalobacterales bacterium]|nr:MBL fold metallo-hydrolase [Thiohalobacterales bacterium]